ncbi:ROK family protein [Paenibacillus sp. B2(2019)]|uniref:ROK family protein n=1 Tax=Paenibacillus sp. B2(2019) TaxID=2607754 RepID=UPI0011F1DB13|nr:ROK family protein [Paenibacillus sp. B2(2019)]KAA1189394.1 ROK family protein [Paenibacillus sp. B2(2019)]
MRILAVDIGGTNTKMCICDKLGNVHNFKEYATESHLGGPHVILRLLDKIAENDDFDAIAISTAGQVNAEEGIIVYANENIPRYTGMKIKEIVTNHFHKPVMVENDVNSAALGEAHYGAAQNFNNFLCLTFGTGIGGAIVLNRQIYKGADGVAAEFGHILTHPLSDVVEGLPFYEKYASTTALVKMAQQADPECTDGKVLFDKIHKGDEALKQILDSWVTEVSVGLASIIHIFNPSAIIIGGGVMEQEDLVQRVEERTKSLIMESFAGVRIVKASLGNKAGLLGASSLFAH